MVWFHLKSNCLITLIQFNCLCIYLKRFLQYILQIFQTGVNIFRHTYIAWFGVLFAMALTYFYLYLTIALLRASVYRNYADYLLLY